MLKIIAGVANLVPRNFAGSWLLTPSEWC